LGDSQNILTCGFSKLSEREYAVWDVRNFNAPLIKKRLDDYSGVPFIYFDEDHKVVYVAGKGESAISFFQYSHESANLIDYLGSFKGKEPQKGFSFMPKKVVDLMANEVNRGVRLTAKTVEYVYFKVPRKSGTFQADLYPPSRSQEAAMKFDDYIGGQNLEPLRVELRPETKVDAVSAQKKANFMSKIGAQESTTSPVVQQITQAPSRSQADEDEIKALRRKIEELNEELAQQRQTNHQLQNEVESLTQTNENLVYTNHSLKSELEQAQD
jgi:coronin-1B/1C/6